MSRKTRGHGAVDDAVVVGQRHRKDHSWYEFLAVPRGLYLRFGDTKDGDLWRVDDRCEKRSANAAQAGNRETAALHLGGRELAVARLGSELAGFPGNLDDRFSVGILDYRHDEAVWRVGSEADIEIFLEHEVLAARLKRGIELGEFLQLGNASLDEEGEHGDLGAALGEFFVGRDAEGFGFGDVGFVELRDVRNADPIAVQILS